MGNVFAFIPTGGSIARTLVTTVVLGLVHPANEPITVGILSLCFTTTALPGSCRETRRRSAGLGRSTSVGGTIATTFALLLGFRLRSGTGSTKSRRNIVILRYPIVFGIIPLRLTTGSGSSNVLLVGLSLLPALTFVGLGIGLIRILVANG